MGYEVTDYSGLDGSCPVRSETEIQFTQEFIDDVFWLSNFYRSLDNKPSDSTVEKYDIGITNSIGWGFWF